MTLLAWSASWGSSPHTRGARISVFPFSPGGRIIPAYAGSTPSGSPPPAPRRDHPRIRGEHLTRAPPTGLPSGSSPHTRGALASAAAGAGAAGIIPAYAGSTRSPPSPTIL